MPIRLTCPSCSATLSVKDEYAGRAVKCPKCGGVIPASQPAAPTPAAPAAAAPAPPKAAPAAPPPPPPPAPAPAAEKSPFEELDEPAKPAKAGSKITGTPKSRSKDEDEDDEDRPRKKRGDDDEDDRDSRKPAKSKRGDDEDEDADRPRKKRRDDDDDDDDSPRGRRGQKPKGKSNVLVILAVVGFFMLTCCGGVGYGVYYLVQKGKEGLENVQKQLGLADNFAKVKVGTTTRKEVEAIFGAGQPATMDELKKAYAAGGVPEGWNKLIAEGRAFMWVKGDDRVFMAFHPNGNPDSKVQRKNLAGKYVGFASDGELDDAKYAQLYLGKSGEDLSGPAVEVSAEELTKEYATDAAAADAKYKDKVLVVEGKLSAIDSFGASVTARLRGTGTAFVQCQVQRGDSKQVWSTSRGQSIKFRGRCLAGDKQSVTLGESKYVSRAPDTFNTSAAAFFNEFKNNPAAAEEKYKEQQVTIHTAAVESKQDQSVVLVAPGKAKTAFRIKVTLPFDYKNQLDTVKNGDVITIKGEFSSVDGQVININSAWIVPK